MDFEYSARTTKYLDQVRSFIDAHILPSEALYAQQLESASSRWAVPPVMEELKARARREGLWNLFLPESEHGAGFTNLEYAPIGELGTTRSRPRCSTALPLTHRRCSFGTHPRAEEEWLAPPRGNDPTRCDAERPCLLRRDQTSRPLIVRDGESKSSRHNGASAARSAVPLLTSWASRSAESGFAKQHRESDHARYARHTLVRMQCVGSATRRTDMESCCSRTCACRRQTCPLGEGRGFVDREGRLGPTHSTAAAVAAEGR